MVESIKRIAGTILIVGLVFVLEGCYRVDTDKEIYRFVAGEFVFENISYGGRHRKELKNNLKISVGLRPSVREERGLYQRGPYWLYLRVSEPKKSYEKIQLISAEVIEENTGLLEMQTEFPLETSFKCRVIEKRYYCRAYLQLEELFKLSHSENYAVFIKVRVKVMGGSKDLEFEEVFKYQPEKKSESRYFPYFTT